jgi:hypothetical protein
MPSREIDSDDSHSIDRYVRAGTRGVGLHAGCLCAGAATPLASSHTASVTFVLSVIVYSDRSACNTSTRAARAAGMSDATMAAPMSTAVAPMTGRAPGSCTAAKLAATSASR